MVGSDLVRYLSQYFSVASVTKENYFQFVGESFDILINANGNTKRFWANSNPLDDFIASTVSIYKSIFDFKYSTYIYISSSDVYKDHSNSLHTFESQFMDSNGLPPYGLHKYLSEKIIENNCSNYIILRSSLILGSNLKKGPIYDILHKKPLYISNSSKLQMITTKEIANVVKLLLNEKITKDVFNMGGKGIVDFKKIQAYFSMPITFSKEAETQAYEMDISKLSKLFPLKTSGEYLQEFLNTLQ